MPDQTEASNNPEATPESGPAKESAAPAIKTETESWIELAKTILYAGLIALGIRTTLFQPFNIPSQSMEATLLVGDYLFVEKYAYGYSRFSIPFGKYFPSIGRIFGSPPERGDVVVFKFPPDQSTDYIKRVIGLPGDRIQMRDGILYINEKPVPKERVEDYVEYIDGEPNQVPQYRETLPNGVSYLTLDRIQNGWSDTTDVYVVPPAHYFMMGDNRDNSADSRADVGFVPEENLVGKAKLRFFSIDSSAIWYEPWTWPFAVRYSRLFTIIH